MNSYYLKNADANAQFWYTNVKDNLLDSKQNGNNEYIWLKIKL